MKAERFPARNTLTCSVGEWLGRVLNASRRFTLALLSVSRVRAIRTRTYRCSWIDYHAVAWESFQKAISSLFSFVAHNYIGFSQDTPTDKGTCKRDYVATDVA